MLLMIRKKISPNTIRTSNRCNIIKGLPVAHIICTEMMHYTQTSQTAPMQIYQKL